jgi:hypothetical protein
VGFGVYLDDNFKNMKISDDRGKILDPAGKRDISEISDPTGRYFFPAAILCFSVAKLLSCTFKIAMLFQF